MKKRISSNMGGGPLSDPTLLTEQILRGKGKMQGQKSTGVKFNLPPDGDDENVTLTGFGEINTLPPVQKKTLGQLGRQATGITKWKPGHSIKKFDFNDLPSIATLADAIFKDDDYGMPPGLGNIMAKSKETMKREPTKVVGLTHRKPRGETFLGGHPEFLKDDLLKVSAQIKGDLEVNMGFGFTNSSKKPSPKFGADGGQHVGKRPESHTKLVEKSITSLQSRIQEQRKKFQEYQSASLDFPTSPKLANQQRPDLGKLGTFSEAPPKNFFLRKKAQENAKLGEVARLFRQSLEAAAKDPTEVIRLPGREKSPARKAPTTITKGSVVLKTPGVSKPFLGKPKSTMGAAAAGVGRKKDPSGLMDLRQLLAHRNPSTFDPYNPLSKLMNPLEFTKKKIQELEEPFSSFSSRQGKKPPSAEFADYLDDMEKEASALGKPSARLGSAVGGGVLESNASKRYPAVPTEALEKRLGASLKTMDEAGMVAKNLGSLMSRVTATRPPPQQGAAVPVPTAAAKVTAADLAKTLGLKFDVNTILNATTPRDQQKQLMKLTEEMRGIVAAAVKGDADDGDGDDGGSSSGSGSPNRNHLYFRPRPVSRQAATTTATGTSPIPSPSSGKRFQKTGNKKAIEIQTDGPPAPPLSSYAAPPGKGPMRFEMPDIKFVKEMSETDQRQLQELRALKSKWDTFDYGSGSPTIN